jgi:hypothetical protein
MFPHERSLVKRLQGKPFVLIGVNSDRNREDVKKKNEAAGITWRSFSEGGKGGPIAKAWNIRGWPTLYVIDAQGVIRRKHLGAPDDAALDKEINVVLKAMGVDINVDDRSPIEKDTEKKAGGK